MSRLISKILEFSDEAGLLPERGAVIACVSGGADSVCLLQALIEIAPGRGFEVCAAHYNHMLRGESSDWDESFVWNLCMERGVALYRGRGDVAARARSQGIGIEEAAREMRYAFFAETAASIGASAVATAHTADDNAETILLNFSRGAGTAGLSGIPPKRALAGGAEVIRPMLTSTREDVMAFLGERGISHVEDRTNLLDIYARNKLRLKVMPVLREINPAIARAAATAAALTRADEEFLSGLADDFIEKRCRGGAADAAELARLPSAIAGRVIRKLYGRNLAYGHVKSVIELCGRGGEPRELSLPGMAARVENGELTFREGPRERPRGFEPMYPEAGDSSPIPGTGLKISCKKVIYDGTINKSFTSFLFQSVDLCGKICVRPRREGDAIKFLGSNHTKTLKKLFIERNVPAGKRALVPVVADDAGVLAVYGMGAGSRAAPGRGNEALAVEFEGECRP